MFFLSENEIIACYRIAYKNIKYAVSLADMDELQVKRILHILGQEQYKKENVVGVSIKPYSRNLNQGILYTTNSLCVKEDDCYPEQFIIKYEDIKNAVQSEDSEMAIDIITHNDLIYTVNLFGAFRMGNFINTMLKQNCIVENMLRKPRFYMLKNKM